MIGLNFDPFRSLFDMTEVVPRSIYSVNETEDSILITTDLPGVKLEDIQIAAENNVLSVRAERKGRSYSYAWSLPKTVNAEVIEAEYEDGVLTLNLPKLETAKLRQIPVKAKKELAASASA